MSDDLNENFRVQTATVWIGTGADSAGEVSFAAPRQITVRWEQKSKAILNAEGEEVVSTSRVYVGEDLTTDDFLLLGTNTDADPTDIFGAYKIKMFHKVATPTGKKFVRKAFL